MGDRGPGRGKGKRGGRGAWGGSKNEKKVTTQSDGFWTLNSSEGGCATSKREANRISTPVAKKEEKNESK